MTTEDDTFNALRREPFESVIKEIAERAGSLHDLSITKSVWASGNDNLDPAWLDFLEARGWTIKEFENHCKRDMQEYKVAARRAHYMKITAKTT